MAKLPVFSDAALQQVSKILADAATGSELTPLLARVGAPDPGGGVTKWRRVEQALAECQQKHSVGNHVVQFILAAMDPVRFAGNAHAFENLRARLNVVLAFSGYSLHEDGKLRHADGVTKLSEAEERAGRLRAELSRRRVHADVLKACRAELLQDNYFHAVLEATKSVAEKIRVRSKLTLDGSALVDEAFGVKASGHPRLAFNSLRTQTEKSEHSGLMNLMKGTFSAFRNPTAHEPKERFVIEEHDALDLLSLVSLLHRRLDSVIVVPPAPPP